MLVDSHCHLDSLDLSSYDGDLTAALAAARSAQVSAFLCIATGSHNVDAIKQITDTHEGVYAAVGIHPLSESHAITETELLQWSDHPKVVAIGETGLDYYYSEATHEAQKASFLTHIQAACNTAKPLVVHTRSAQQDTLELIANEANQEVGGVLHCFTEGWDMAAAAMDMNFYISISGIVTFKNADNVREVVRKMPLDRLLVETDSPWLAPVPYRGKSNEPKYVREVAQTIADLKDISLEELADITTRNFRQLFSIDQVSQKAVAE